MLDALSRTADTAIYRITVTTTGMGF